MRADGHVHAAGCALDEDDVEKRAVITMVGTWWTETQPSCSSCGISGADCGARTSDPVAPPGGANTADPHAPVKTGQNSV